MMKRIRLWLVSSCMALVAGCPSSSGRSPSGPDGAVDPPCSVLAHAPYWAQEPAAASFEKHIGVVDYLSVFWYNLGPDGEIRKYLLADEDRELIERAHQHGAKVLALVANLPDDERGDDRGTWDPERVGRVIRSSAARAAHIEELLALTRRMDFDGVYIDYEALPATDREAFTLFIRDLGEALHAENKILAVAIHPKTSENNPLEDNGSAAQDWEALHPYADQLHFMTYSEHTAATYPGPVASARWVERVLRYAIETRQIPPAKIYMGVPLYAEEWYQTISGRYRNLDEDIMFEDAQRRKQQHHGTERWSTEHASPYIVYRDQEARQHVIWFENKRSIAEKLAIAHELGICNLSLWRLGGEDPRIWELMREDGQDDSAPARERSDGARDATDESDESDDSDGSDEGNEATEQDGDGGDTDGAGDADGEREPEEADDSDADGADDADEADGASDVDGADDDNGASEADDTGDGAGAGDEAGDQGEAGASDEDGASDGGSMSSGEEPPATWRLSARGRDHPRLAGETSASLEFYSAFAATDPATERENWMAYLDSAQALVLTSRLGIESDLRLVVESDGEDARFYTDFPHEGLYVKSLVLRYATDRYSLFAGKYEPAADIRGHAPIFFGNYSTDLHLGRLVGAGASVTLAHGGIAQHTLTGHVFHRDTSRLSGEVFSGRDRNAMYDGTLARTGRPDSHLVTLNGESTADGPAIAYTLGWGRQRNADSMSPDELIYLAALRADVPLGAHGDLAPSVDLMSLRNNGGQHGNTHNILLGLTYGASRFSVGAAYSLRLGDPGPQNGRKDLITELLARYDLGRGFWLEAAYQNVREAGGQDHLFGVVLGCMREWLVH